MQRPATSLAAKSGLPYGYGLGIYQHQRNSVSFYGHGGDADGYLSFFAYSPRHKLGYFVVINAFKKSALVEMKAVLENEIVNSGAKPSFPKDLELSSLHIELLAGTYREVTRRFRRNTETRKLSVSADGERYFSSIGARKRRKLIAVTPRHFRRTYQSVATIAFIPCRDRIYLQGDFGNFEKLLPRNQITEQ